MKSLTLSLISVFLFATVAQAELSDQKELLNNSLLVLEEMMDAPDEGIPTELISQAKAIIIFPTMVKGGFFFAARYGKGVVAVRSEQTGRWEPISFVYTTGLSFGLQIGAEAVDLILLVMTERGLKGLLKDHFTLGGDLGVAVGPLGRHAEASADVLMQGGAYAYSRSMGAFAGISVKGTVITADNTGNYHFYDKALTPQEILLDNKIPKMPESGKQFIRELNRLAPPMSSKKAAVKIQPTKAGEIARAKTP